MEGWQIGLIAVVAIGLAVIVFGAVRDRRLNERRRREMLAPPQRDIPRFAPDAPTPRYLSELQARRPPAGAQPTTLTDDERARLRAAIERPDTLTLQAGYASPDLVTDTATGWCVVRRPAVLVSRAPVRVVRELLGVLERQVPTGRPLVVVAPEIGPELIATFGVNHIQRVITIVPVLVSEQDALDRIAEATGATPVTHADLQSGYCPPDLLGSCPVWISTADRSHLLADDPPARTEPTDVTEPGGR